MSPDTVPPQSGVVWEAPDPGVWELETAHAVGVASVPLLDAFERGFAEGFRNSFAKLGVPLSHIEIRHVNGWPYTSVFVHDAPRSAGGPPPDIVLKLISRLHPAARRRTKVATRALRDRVPQHFTDEWEAERAGWIQRNLDYQHIDAHGLGDEELARHVEAAETLGYDALKRHFELVPGSIPLGHWFVKSAAWGLSPDDARSAVMHSTPVHLESRRRVRKIVDALGDAQVDSLDEIRKQSPAAANALTDYLDHHGCWSTGDDPVRGTTIVSHPELIMKAIAAERMHDVVSAETGSSDAAKVLAALRSQVPTSEHADFDRVAADAHHAHMMLDDNSGILSSWVAGIVGRALQAAGQRLAQRGLVESADDLAALSIAEISDLLRGDSTLTRGDITSRVTQWRALDDLDPPASLNGTPSPPPDPSVFPAPVAELVAAVGAFLSDKFNYRREATGVGRAIARGRAVVVQNASEAIERLEPGDILVTASTTPAYNAVLPMLGGLVVAEGGASSHAAIVAREFGLSAVVGFGTIATIPDGATIELDPVAATVRVLDAAAVEQS